MRLLTTLLLFLATLFLSACDLKPKPPPAAAEVDESKTIPPRKGMTRPGEKPVPPLRLPAPDPMPSKVDGKDLPKMEEDELFARTMQAMGKADYKKAAAHQYWYVQKSKTGQYNLACFLAQIKEVNAAFYWLQLAAIEEGVDTQHAQRDEDLVSLRSDPRWPEVRRYLQDCNLYFETAGISRTVLILPKKYDKSQAIPAVLWLHGLGSRPEDFVNEETCQDFADESNVAIVGVSGTKTRGPRSFVWRRTSMRTPNGCRMHSTRSKSASPSSQATSLPWVFRRAPRSDSK